MEVLYSILCYSVVFLYGIIIGSFLNVCIFRIPKKESVSKSRSHCMACGYQLRWYDLVPIMSYVCLKGRCRKCREKISIQYPLVEALNGILYVIVFLANGYNLTSVIFCLVVSALIVLSVIDWRIYEIPLSVNIVIFLLAVCHTAIDYQNWISYVIGMVAVSAVLALLYYFSGGKAIGGGDVKLMAAAGLLLGWQKIIVAFLLGCVIGSVIHVLRMKIEKTGSVLAMGPYLSAGIVLAMLWGDEMIRWYLRLCGINI
ncbi:MAG: prepilin peptidase [Clostridiales bacterium]|nr:prepilin peptidase [Clostridiales bacterium]